MWLCSFSVLRKFMFGFGIQKDLTILGFIVIFWHDNTWGRLRIFHGSSLDLMGDPELSKFWSNPLGIASMAYKTAWRQGWRDCALIEQVFPETLIYMLSLSHFFLKDTMTLKVFLSNHWYLLRSNNLLS
jgi:hypothetical protein